MTATQATNVAIGAGSFASVTSVSLTAGDWEVWGGAQFINTAAMTGVAAATGNIRCAVHNANNVFPPAYNSHLVSWGTASQANLAAGSYVGMAPPKRRFNSSASQVVYLLVGASAAGNAQGFIAARRMR
jgi:hypothetical protein